MKKSLSLLLAIAMVFGMFSSLAFAAEKSAGEYLKEIKVITGNNAGDLMEDSKWVRQDVVVILSRLMGLEAEAKETAKSHTFGDVKTEFYHGYISWAKENGYFNGHSDVRFGYGEEITNQQFLAVMLRALGYEVDYKDVIEEAVALGLVEEGINPKAAATRGAYYDIIVTTLNTENAEGVVLGEALELPGFVSEEEPVTEYKVNKVTVPNGRQVVVSFTQAIDADTVTADTVKVYVGTSTTATTWTKFVSEDKKTVTLGLNATVPQDTNVKVVVKDVENAAKAKLAETTNTVKMVDVTSPVVLNAIATTSKTITVTTSEPVDLAAGSNNFHVLTNVKIGGLALVGKLTQDFAKNEIVVELGTKLTVGSHEVVIEGLKDFAGFNAEKFTATVVVVEDTAAPVMVSASTSARNKVTVTFDEPIATLGSITVNGVTYTSGTQSADKKSFEITLTAPLGLASLVKETISYVNTTDMEGNVVTSAKTLDFVATDDATVPTATIAIATGNAIEITFSEPMSDAGKIKILKADGTVHLAEAAPVLDGTAKKATVSAAVAGFNSAGSASTFTIELTGAKDSAIRQNTIAKTTASISIVDNVAPQIVNVVQKEAYSAGPPVVHGKATVFFNEAMDIDTLKDLRNYLVDFDGAGGAAAVLLSSISNSAAAVSGDAKAVDLTIPGASFTAGTTTVAVLGVKDTAGNLIQTADFNAAKVIAATAPATNITAREVVATNKIKVTFNQAIGTVDPSDFKVYRFDGTTLAFVGVAYELNAARTEVTVTLNGNLRADANVVAADGLAKLAIGSATAATKDIFGVSVNSTATAVADKVAPTLTKVEKGATPNSIKFTFSEAVNEAAADNFRDALLVKKTDGSVITYGGAGLTVTGLGTSEVVVRFSGATLTAIKAIGTNVDGEKAIKVSFPAAIGIRDVAGTPNAIAPVTTETEVKVDVDTTAPIATLVSGNTTTLVVQFNEDLYNAGVAIANGANVKALFVYTGTAANYTSATYDATNKRVTFVFTAAENNETLTAQAALTDASGLAVDTGSDVATYTHATTSWALN